MLGVSSRKLGTDRISGNSQVKQICGNKMVTKISEVSTVNFYNTDLLTHAKTNPNNCLLNAENVNIKADLKNSYREILKYLNQKANDKKITAFFF